MLSVVDGEEFEIFWPESDEVIETDVYTCRQISVNKTTSYVIREFLLKSVQDDYEIRTKFIQSLNWPHHGVPSIKHICTIYLIMSAGCKETDKDQFVLLTGMTFCYSFIFVYY